MNPKSIVLLAACVVVLGMGVYLFVQVRGTPAQAGASGTPRSHDLVAESPPSPPPPAATTKPTLSRPPATGDAASKVHVGNDVMPSSPPQPPTDEQRANPKLESMMELANKAYDRQEYDDASAIAGKVLTKEPTNIRMLRIMVSANCIQGDATVAQQYYERLPKFDREQMKTRCDRYGVTFKEPSQ